MVKHVQRLLRQYKALSVLALSSRFDGRFFVVFCYTLIRLSVLALSSRFDGHRLAHETPRWHMLSVLALSSRFDGRIGESKSAAR